MGENEPTERPSMMAITGQSASMALGTAVVVVLLLTLVYGLMAASMAIGVEEGGFDLSLFTARIWGIFQVVGMCAGPVVFILSFALLQRFRIK